MKRTTLLVATLLVAASLQAQEPQRAILYVETGEPTPTVVKTAETITINYRVRWYNLAQRGEGEEVIIFEDDMKPESGRISFDPFEIVDLEIGKLGEDEDEYYKDFTYTLRPINKQKSSDQLKYEIPSFRFPWAVKEPGDTDESEYEQLEFETDPVPIHYVTTILPDEELYIRDEFYFPDYRNSSLVYRILPIVLILGSVVWLAFGLTTMRIPLLLKKKKKDESEHKRPGVVFARRRFYKLLRELESNVAKNQIPDQTEVANDLYPVCHDLIMAELPEINRSHTANEIFRYILSNPLPLHLRSSLGRIAGQMIACAKIFDGLKVNELHNKDSILRTVKSLRSSANQLVWYKKLWARVALWKR